MTLKQIAKDSTRYLLWLGSNHIKYTSRKPVTVHSFYKKDIPTFVLQYMWDKYPIFVAKILNNSKISLKDIELAKRYY